MATKYVRVSGSDSTGDGSSGNPYLTIAKANTVVSSGDTVDIGEGTFSETNQICKVSNVTYQGAGMFKTTIIGDVYRAINICLVNDMRINMLTSNATNGSILLNNNSVLNRVYFDGTGIIYAVRPIDTYGGFTAVGCVFRNMYISGEYWILGQGAGTYKLYNNVFYNCWGNYFAYCYNHATNAIVKNNIFYYSMYNNTVFLVSTTGTLTESNNCKYVGGTRDLVTNNINADPLFVDGAGGDFRLQSSSPCKGKGTSTLP